MKDEVGFYDHYVHYTKYTFLFLKIFLKKKIEVCYFCL